jgi:type IV pilus assembly protein PilM
MPDITKMTATLIQNVWRPRNLIERFTDLDWKRLLNLEERPVLGLDIGSSTVKMVELHKNNTGYAVTAAGIVEIANGAEDGKNHKEPNTVKAIKDCLQSIGTQTRFAVCSVCGPEVAVRHFKFPSLLPEETEGAVLLEAAQVCPFNINDSTVDYQLVPDGGDNVSGVLVAATNKLIKSKRQLTENASLNSVLMDVDGLALLNCFNGFPSCKRPHLAGSPDAKKQEPKKSQNRVAGEYEKPEAGRTMAILNVGSSFTNLAIMGDNSLPFIRDMAYAGNDIVKQIAAENDISTQTVGRILSGHANSSGAQLKNADSLAKACRKLIVDVTETLRYYAAQEKSAIVEKIFVCGGFALVKGFVELLDNQLPAEAVLWNPFEKIQCDAGQNCRDILQKSGPAMAVAAGLAMRSI